MVQLGSKILQLAPQMVQKVHQLVQKGLIYISSVSKLCPPKIDKESAQIVKQGPKKVQLGPQMVQQGPKLHAVRSCRSPKQSNWAHKWSSMNSKMVKQEPKIVKSKQLSNIPHISNMLPYIKAFKYYVRFGSVFKYYSNNIRR